MRSETPLSGGFTHAAPRLMELDDGRAVVVKMGTDDRTRGEVAHEAHVLAHYGLPCMPRLIAHRGPPDPIVVIEDLRAAHWPPPWPDPAAVLATLDTLAQVPAVDGLPPLRNDRVATWETIVRAPSAALLEAVPTWWLDRVAPVLAASAATVDVEGDRLVHADIWSANICVTEDRGPILIDWAGASAANPEWDRATFTLSYFIDHDRLFPDPWSGRRGWSAMLAALKCRAVGLGNPAWVTDGWHQQQMADLHQTLRWAAREHDLPPPPA